MFHFLIWDGSQGTYQKLVDFVWNDPLDSIVGDKNRSLSFGMYTRGRRGSSKSERHTYKGEGADTSKYVRKKSLFTRILWYFKCKVLLPYFLVFSLTLHYCFKKHLLWLLSCLSNVFTVLYYSTKKRQHSFDILKNFLRPTLIRVWKRRIVT